MPSPDDKIVKNRVHLDLNPGPDASGGERDAEIERLIALGARPVDVGQRGDEAWTVLADPRATSSASFARRNADDLNAQSSDIRVREPRRPNADTAGWITRSSRHALDALASKRPGTRRAPNDRPERRTGPPVGPVHIGMDVVGSLAVMET